MFDDDPRPEQRGRTGWRAIPPITWIGLLFVIVGLTLLDLRALVVGGLCLLVATIQGLLDR